MPINATEYLRDLATRLRKVPVCHGVDGYDIDTLREVSMGIAELEKANVAYVDANTLLTRENENLRDALLHTRDTAVEDVLAALVAHELYQYRPKAFHGFIEYARTLKNEENAKLWRDEAALTQPDAKSGEE